MSFEDVTDDDKKHCESIGKSVSEIIRFSFDEDFRKNIFRLLGTSSTKDTENEISKRLKSMIQARNEASAPIKKGKTLSEEKENLEEEDDTSEMKEAYESPITNADSESSSSQKSWLQISSEHYLNAAERKKLNFFSQPLLSQAYEREFEFPSCSTHHSNSQPQTSSSSSFYNMVRNSSPEPSDGGTNFCRKRFKESFKDNACKYLKKNSKSHKKFG